MRGGFLFRDVRRGWGPSPWGAAGKAPYGAANGGRTRDFYLGKVALILRRNEFAAFIASGAPLEPPIPKGTALHPLSYRRVCPRIVSGRPMIWSM